MKLNAFRYQIPNKHNNKFFFSCFVYPSLLREAFINFKLTHANLFVKCIFKVLAHIEMKYNGMVATDLYYSSARLKGLKFLFQLFSVGNFLTKNYEPIARKIFLNFWNTIGVSFSVYKNTRYLKVLCFLVWLHTNKNSLRQKHFVVESPFKIIYGQILLNHFLWY